MDSKHQQPSKIVPPSSSSSSSPTSQSKTKPNLEFNMTNKSGQSIKLTPSPTASTSFKLRKSMTLNTNSNTIRKQQQQQQQQTPSASSSSSYNATTAVPATNSMTSVNKRNDQETLLPTSTQSRFSKPKSIYVNDNFDEFIRQNELPNCNASHKLNETIVKSPKRDRDDIVTNEANFTGVGCEKTPSLCSSTSSKIKITSYTLNHQNQIELQQQQQLRNSTNKSINRLAYSKSSSRNNLGASTTTVVNSKSKLPINTSESSNGNKAPNVKLCRVIKTDQASGSYALPLSARKRHEHEKSRNSIFISSASTLLTNETYSPNEDFILNSIDFTKVTFF